MNPYPYREIFSKSSRPIKSKSKSYRSGMVKGLVLGLVLSGLLWSSLGLSFLAGKETATRELYERMNAACTKGSP